MAGAAEVQSETKISIREILEAHRAATTEKSLAKSLGDGYLCANNPYFKNIRAAASGFGVTFTTRDYCNYRVFHLGSLPGILRTKKIVYQDNWSPLAALEKSRPGVFYDDAVTTVTKNYVMHECCHLIGNSVSPVFLDEDSIKQADESARQRDVVKHIMYESFAQTMEVLAQLPLKTRLDRFFFNYNSPRFLLAGETAEALHRSANEAGFDVTFKVVLTAYLFYNFLFTDLNEKGLDAILDFWNVSETGERVQKALLELCNFPKRHSGLFRTEASDLYFKLIGYRESVHQLLNFNFMKVLGRSEELRGTIERLSKISETSKTK